jgi:TonB-dependent starch-binding outer membrane protein SusC
MKHCCQHFNLSLEHPLKTLRLTTLKVGFAVLLCFFVMGVSAQSPIQGTVSSADSALEGATVTLKGTNISTSTNASGHFQINAPVKGVLVISYIGFASKEVPIKSAGPLSIRLDNGSAQLNDIVVVGYGTQRKSDVTGSVSSVKMKDIAETPSSRIDDALQGRSAGVSIQHTDASPDATIAIRIRGISSINGGNDPLVVIDGLQGGNLNSLNPEEVQSIEILKDASATAIYGSRGANGVVLVTTKKGREGKYQVSYNGLFSSTSVRKKIALMNPFDYATTVNANRVDLGVSPVFNDSALNSFKNGAGTNWQDAIFRKGYNQNHTLTVSGGNDRTTYFLSGNLNDVKGIILNSGYKRYSLRSNVTSKVSDKLTVGVNLFLAKELNHPTYLNGFSNGSPIFSALLFAPTKPIYNPDGSYSQPGGGYGPPTNYNPVALAVEPVRDYNLYTTNIIGYADYALMPGLHINISGGYKLSSATNNDYVNSKADGAPGTETATIYDSTFVTYQNTNMITYDKQIHDHHIKVTALMEQQYQVINQNTAGSIGFLTDANTYNNLSLGSNPQTPSSAERKNSLLSYMGRINYGYKDLYLVTLTARADAASVFGASNKWGYFPSVAVGWNVSNESFMKSMTSVSNLKIRGSYGVVGNQAIPPYNSLALLNTNLPYPINGSSPSPGVGAGGFPNLNLKWEKTAQFNVGFDLSLLASRLNLTADYYNKHTSDLLLSVPTPLDAGGNGFLLENVGSVQNRGVEFTLGGRPVAGAFVWESNLTVAVNHNKVLNLIGGVNAITLGGPGLPNFGNTIWLEDGKPLGEFRALQFEGVWKSSEAAQAAAYGAIPGSPKYLDVNKDGKIDANDIVDVGNAQPKYTFGWSNTFTFKNIDLNVFVQGSQGGQIYNISRVRFETTSGDADATSVKILNRWSPTNENTDVPSFQGSTKSENLQSTRWLENGSYVRIKNISLGYTLPGSVFNKKIQSARLYVSGTNLITFTKYSGFDPEASSGVDGYAGVDLATYPSQKAVTIGLNINF